MLSKIEFLRKVVNYFVVWGILVSTDYDLIFLKGATHEFIFIKRHRSSWFEK